MTGQDDIRRLLQCLAAHPVLPPTDLLPPNDAALHALLADLAAGERSRYADLLRDVAGECGLAAEELAQRAEFLLACLILPRTGTYYEVLGVAPTASADEIRRRWAALIQRYHPDHLGGSDWVDDQAQRLIEAYQTLRDPDRRRRYDAELARQRAPVAAPSPSRRAPRPPQPQRWRWVPVALIGLGSAAMFAIYAWRTPSPLPQVALPPAPNLQEARQQAVFADALTHARAAQPSATAVEAAPGPASLSAPAESQAATPVPPSQRVKAPPLDRPLDQEPVDTPRLAVKPRKSAASAAKRPETPPMRSAASRHVRDDEAGTMPRISEGLAVRPELNPSATRLEASDVVVRHAPVEAPTAAQDTRLDPDQGELVRSQAPRVQPPERAGRLQPTVRQTEPMAARIEPHDGGAGRLLTSHALAVIETFRAAYEGKDLNTMMRLFAAVPRERNTVGRSAVQELYARHFATLDRIRYELSHLAMTPAAANGALIVQGRFRIRAVRQDNPSDPLSTAGAIRWVLRPEADALRIAEIDYELSRR